MMDQSIKRRDLLIQGGAAAAALAVFDAPRFARAFPARPGEQVIAWLDQPASRPARAAAANLLRWEEVNSWITSNDKFFDVAHYNRPVIDEKTWALRIDGLVQRPLTLTLSEIRARPRQEIAFTLECSGNNGHPWFIGGIGTARWGGAPLAAILDEAQVMEGGSEVVFWGGDAGEEEVRHIKMAQNFARSMSLADARGPNNLLCYEMNGQPLPQRHGFPLRLIAPGWYGIDNGPWRPAQIDRGEETEFTWQIWSLDWPDPAPGEHGITPRAFDTAGHMQPPSNDPAIVNKQTYWESNGQITRRIRI